MRTFKSVVNYRPRHSVFDLSYEKKFTCDMGQLIPVLCEEVVPGDFFKIGNQAIIRFQPMVAPALHEINIFVHYFFVPYRLLWAEPNGWQTFISGGTTGNLTPTLPRWDPTNYALNSLWDYLGFPAGIKPNAAQLPMAFPLNAYNYIYNEYYRDETLTTAVDLTTQEAILYRAWEKDYFTSSLPWLQRGTAPALPISGLTSAVWTDSHVLASTPTAVIGISEEGSNSSSPNFYVGAGQSNARLNLKAALNSNTVDLSSATTFGVNDLRLAFQIQRWLERNARSGARYTEFLRSHFGVSPRDDRLQRPEYIGGTKSPIIISEVLQTSASNAQPTPQGNMAGHGIGVNASYAGKYHATEYGLIMGIMSVMPKPAYQQGINRQWLRTTKYDFYFPEFAHLSEQAIQNVEIYAQGTSADADVFGYQGRYDEMRYKPNMIVGEMRTTYKYWHFGRIFGSLPLLNDSFVSTSGGIRKDAFAVTNIPELIVSFGNVIKAYRPIPIMAEPGLIDH